MSRFTALFVAVISVVLCGPSAHAQGQEIFVQGLVAFINAINAPQEDRATAAAALNAMEAGLAQWDAAIARAEAGLAADIGGAPPPLAARMRATLGLLYLERGRAGDALQQLDAAVRGADPPADLDAFRGWALRAAGRRAEAADAFERAFEANPGDPAQAYLFLHHARMAGRAASAASLRAAAVIASLEGGLHGLAAGARPFVVPALIDDSASDEPVVPPARYSAGFALLRQGRYGEALSAWRTAAAGTDLSPDGRELIARAHDLLARGSGQEAVAQFEAAAARNPIVGAAPLHVLIGQLHENQFDAERAVQGFVRAIDVDLNHAAAHRELAEALQALDRLDEARTEFIVSLRIDPLSAVAWTGLGQVHAAEGRTEPAVAAFQRAVTIDARNREARYALARALMQAGRAEDGQRELAVFERLQAEAMAEERKRYEENLRRIEAARDAAPGAGR